MSRRFLATLLTTLFAVGICPAAAADPPADGRNGERSGNDGDVAAAIRDLGDPSFQVRQEAEGKLRKSGPRARPLLKEASSSGHPEVANRARAILQELEAQRLGFDAILDRVHRAASSDDCRKPG